MDLIEIIKSRRTIRKHKDAEVSQDLINKILDAARWAPSAHNLQPWKFVVIQSEDKIASIADILDKKAGELYSGFNIVMRDTAKNLKGSKVLIAAYSNNVLTKKFGNFGPPYDEIGKIYEIQSVTTAIENMLLYAHSVNLCMAWYGMPLFGEEEINKLLGQKGRLMAILSLGHPADGVDTSKRKPLSEIAEFIR